MKELIVKAKRWREWQVFSKMRTMYCALEENLNLIEPYRREVLPYWTCCGISIMQQMWPV